MEYWQRTIKQQQQQKAHESNEKKGECFSFAHRRKLISRNGRKISSPGTKTAMGQPILLRQHRCMFMNAVVRRIDGSIANLVDGVVSVKQWTSRQRWNTSVGADGQSSNLSKTTIFVRKRQLRSRDGRMVSSRATNSQRQHRNNQNDGIDGNYRCCHFDHNSLLELHRSSKGRANNTQRHAAEGNCHTTSFLFCDQNNKMVHHNLLLVRDENIVTST